MEWEWEILLHVKTALGNSIARCRKDDQQKSVFYGNVCNKYSRTVTFGLFCSDLDLKHNDVIRHIER